MRRVIVVGGGLAGLTASIEAHRMGSHVILVEKQAGLFGNSCKASSGINALSHHQTDQGINDSESLFYQDTMRAGHHLNDPELVQTLVHHAKTVIPYLESFGLVLNKITKCGGHSVPRTHRLTPTDKPSSVGWSIISALKHYLETNTTIECVFNAQLIHLIQKDTVQGIVIQQNDTQREIQADAVILATGGYSHDYSDLIKTHVPQYAHLPTTNGPFALGQGAKVASQHGAQLVDMQFVQIHPTGFAKGDNPKFLAPEALRGSGGILLNHKGERFVDELLPRDKVTQAIFDHCEDNKAYLIMSQEAIDNYDPATFAFYEKKGLFTKHTKSDFDKAFKHPLPDTFYMAIVTPVIHYAMGGIKINAAAEVLDTEERPILGLYAAGEVSARLHGQNRLAGNSLLECVVFGRIAGTRASTTSALHSDYVPLACRAKLDLSQAIKLIRFDLPSTQSTTGCEVGQYIAMKMGDKVRYYSPVSRPDDYGKLDLLIKVDERGCMSKFLNDLAIGDTVAIKGPMGDLRIMANGQCTVDHLYLIAGGTGIAPMIQMIRSIFKHGMSTKVTLIYGASEPNELVYRDFLIHKALHSEQLKVTFLIDTPHFAWPTTSYKDEGRISYGVGFCTREMLAALDTSVSYKVIVCGPWKMCQSIKGECDALALDYYSYM